MTKVERKSKEKNSLSNSEDSETDHSDKHEKNLGADFETFPKTK